MFIDLINRITRMLDGSSDYFEEFWYDIHFIELGNRLEIICLMIRADLLSFETSDYQSLFHQWQ